MNFAESELVKTFEHKFKDKILLYIEKMYNKDSPLNKIPDTGERKRLAMIAAKLDPENEDMIKIMDLEDEAVKDLVFEYLSYYQWSSRFFKLVADEQLLIRMFKQIMTPITDISTDDEFLNKMLISRKNLSVETSQLMSSVERQRSDIYGTDDAKLNSEMRVKKILRPEQRLKK